MKLVKLSDLFEIKKGTDLDLNTLVKAEKGDGIRFVSRTEKNNGVSAYVQKKSSINPNPKNVLSIPSVGSVLEVFYQDKEFYSSQNVFIAIPKKPLNKNEMLFYCQAIRMNKWKYSYGRPADTTIRNVLVPAFESIPAWVNKTELDQLKELSKKELDKDIQLDTKSWKMFKISDVFEVEKGKRLTKANMTKGNTKFIGATEYDNGETNRVGQKPIFKGNKITVNYNGSVGEAFYQEEPFWASDDVNVLVPKEVEISTEHKQKWELNKYTAMFFCSILRNEKYRFNYGRKWASEKMKESEIKLPIKKDGTIDFDFMESFVKSLPFSKSI